MKLELTREELRELFGSDDKSTDVKIEQIKKLFEKFDFAGGHIWSYGAYTDFVNQLRGIILLQ